MTDSPLSATPYEVLGIAPTASDAEVRSAYRRRARETHPDTGGDAREFTRVQLAWERIGTPAARRSYDGGRSVPAAHETFEARAPRARTDTRPSARAYGHPGGWRRERFLQLAREWAGRGVSLDNPYDPMTVRSMPRELRHILADALAEEATALALSTLGIAYTVWHDVATDGGPEEKVDHVVLGPTGLFALLSEDWGAAVSVRKGELLSEGLAASERPVAALAARLRSIARKARVRFDAGIIVVPDEATDAGLTLIGRVRGTPIALVQRSRLPELMRDGLPGTPPVGGSELFEIRTRLQSSIRFV
ncbi:J domain-containing protein [Galbitalea soli]|uniref:DnaJ domain-containing protein n=1 Tax=Galbitalea soli TaxID=1268042 RepID=A0A7C9PLA5_9MICO|nr:J domain-containing protein [Galbitalea soli]NEM90114.1 DnaJ domain-containing protein [Galbitalea soli]NYJ30821.1 curved DNA-binding protein CbpA [Galbitalea soli]